MINPIFWQDGEDEIPFVCDDLDCRHCKEDIAQMNYFDSDDDDDDEPIIQFSPEKFKKLCKKLLTAPECGYHHELEKHLDIYEKEFQTFISMLSAVGYIRKGGIDGAMMKRYRILDKESIRILMS